MRRLICWVFFLYPRAWRVRYGREFQALLDDVGPSQRDFRNVLWGAIVMQAVTLKFWKLTAAIAAAGAFVAGIGEATWPGRYQATTILCLNRLGSPPLQAGSELKARLPNGLGPALEEIRTQVTSPQRLGAVIANYRLYPRDRGLSAEELTTKMRRDIAVTVIDAREGDASVGVSFSYPDAEVARSVATDLAGDAELWVEIPGMYPPNGPKGLFWLERPRTVAPVTSEPIRRYRFLFAAALIAAGLVLWEATVRLRPHFATAWPGPIGR
ncbi:MAG: hypothetical protein ABSC23_15105 [Bryobacteraceae bacterium]|jgi:hypothetical protein